MSKKIFKIPLYNVGDTAYFFVGYKHQCDFRVKVLERYRIKGQWYYDLDCSVYMEGLEIRCANEHQMSRQCVRTKKIAPLLLADWEKVIEDFKKSRE